MHGFLCQSDCQTCPDRVVCQCLQVKESQVVEALLSLEIRTLKDLRRCTGAGDGCTCCHETLKGLIEQHANAAEEAMLIPATA